MLKIGRLKTVDKSRETVSDKKVSTDVVKTTFTRRVEMRKERQVEHSRGRTKYTAWN